MVDGQPTKYALSLNTAVADRGRGQGLFTSLAEATYTSARQAGCEAIIGVANAQSTPGFLGKLGFTLVGPLKVSILLPRPFPRGEGVERISLAGLSSEDLQRFQPGQSSVMRVWDSAELAWRLNDPGRTFSVFLGRQALGRDIRDEATRGTRRCNPESADAAGHVKSRPGQARQRCLPGSPRCVRDARGKQRGAVGKGHPFAPAPEAIAAQPDRQELERRIGRLQTLCRRRSNFWSSTPTEVVLTHRARDSTSMRSIRSRRIA